jgi:hypothetical protein
MAKKMGRPRVSKQDALGEIFAVRLRRDEARQVKEAIRKAGLKKPDWLRAALLKAA